MSNNLNPKTDLGQQMVYQIRLRAHLGHQWTDWFGNMAITLEEDDDHSFIQFQFNETLN